MRVIVTGGVGFIGSAVVRRLVRCGHHVLNLDKLTYAARVETVDEAARSPLYSFLRIDIADRTAVTNAFEKFNPNLVLHLAAETHVDRSIENAAVFIRTNIIGTHMMLEVALEHWKSLDKEQKSAFRVIHVSTDEVFGTLGSEGLFSEQSAYQPNSPYAASKAAADHLARAWHMTYGLPVIVTNCSNNYGPWQHPEKLVPMIVRNALANRPIPIYGAGTNIRDWLYVEDHVDGLLAAAQLGEPGESYNFGGDAEKTNIQVAKAVCRVLDDITPRTDEKPHSIAITSVPDRPGHDFRYAVDTSKAKQALGWCPSRDFEKGITDTVSWFVRNSMWFDRSDDDLGRRGLL